MKSSISFIFIAAGILAIEYHPDERNNVILFNALEEALINDSTVLYQLQELFYPPHGAKVLSAEIFLYLTVGNITSCRKDNDSGCGNFVYNKSCNFFQLNLYDATFYWYFWFDYEESKHSYGQLLQFMIYSNFCYTSLRYDYPAVLLFSPFVQGACDIRHFTNVGFIHLHVHEIEDASHLDSPLRSIVSWVSHRRSL